MYQPQRSSMYRTSYHILVPILIALQLVILSKASVSGLTSTTDSSETEPGTFSPGHSSRPQGRETSTTTRSSTVIAPRNFTVSSSSTTRLTIGVNNPLRSRLKRPGVILSLSLRSKDPKLIASSLSQTTSPNPSLSPPTRDDLMTSTISDLTQASFGESGNVTRKSTKILDRLKNLTNLKLKSSAHYGMKNYDNAEEVRAPVTESPVRNDSTRVGGHLSHHKNITQTRPHPMNVQIHNHGTEAAPVISPTTESDLESIEQVETRFVTAEQIGGNRPTKTPFHFTTTTPAPATTTKVLPSRLNRYNKPYSPHNHIYAPTQNPISVAHNEDDLNVEDFRDFRAAHQAFGSKVNSAGAVNREPAHAPPPKPVIRTHVNHTPEKPVVRNTPAYRSPPPRPPTANNPILIKAGKPVQPHPQSASSGVKNSHIKLKQNSDKANNDNLPFYKEPGGVFEHKYTDNDNEPNEIDSHFKAKGSGIKYAPKGPTAQPQTNYNQHVSNSPQRNNHYHNPPPPPTPQYVTVTQQPIYLAPVPIQPLLHHHHQHQPHPGYNPVPQQGHYYPSPQPQPYYPAQPSPAPYAHIPAPPTHYSPVYQAPPQAAPPTQYRPQPQQYDNRPPPHNPYPLRPRPSLPTKKIDHGNSQYYDAPPSRDDPASDSYYGDPRPPKPKPPKPKPPKKPPVEEEPEEEEEPEDEPEEEDKRKEPEEDDQEYRKNKPYRKPNNGPRYSAPRRPNENTNRNNGGNRGRDRDYDEGDANGDEHPIPPVENYDRGGPNYGNNGRNRDREAPSRKQNSNNGGRPRPPFEDYDSDPNEHIDDFVRPSGERPSGYEGPNRDRNFGTFNEGPRSGGGQEARPFYPSEQDRRFRPSSPDVSPNFDHPNIEYPQQRRPSSDRPYSQGREGPSYEDSPSSRSRENDHPRLDPIYTRTIKQFDEENTTPRQRQSNRNNFNPAHEEPEEDGSPKNPDDYAEIGEPRDERRGRERDREEEEEPEPERGQNRERERNRNQPAEEEEEEEEEAPKSSRNRNNRPQEEDEEEEESQQDPKSRNADEEEEEEEEEEKPSNNTPSTSNKKEDKKPPPKKPQQEKSGNLDDDITGIEREFGGYFDQANRPASFNNQQQGQLHPILSLQNQPL